MFQACRKPPTSAILVLTIIILEALIADSFSNDIGVKRSESECFVVQSLVFSDCVTDTLLPNSLAYQVILLKGLSKMGAPWSPLDTPCIHLFNYLF